MKLNIKIYLGIDQFEWNIEYPTVNKISLHVDPGNKTLKINKITLNGIEANIFYNTSFLIDGGDVILHSVNEINKKGTFFLQLDDLYIRSTRSNNWHCSTRKDDYIFQYEHTNNSFSDKYRDRDHKGFTDKFIPCFGCSFTFGAYQPSLYTWPRLLAKKTGSNYLNMGIPGIGVDVIYHNLKLLHKRKGFNQCLILFPNFDRRVVRCKVDDKYISIPSNVDLSCVTCEYSFFRNKKILTRMQQVRNNIIKDKRNRYSKIFLTKIIKYCKSNNVKLSVSSWGDDDEVYNYLKLQDEVNLLPKFPSLFIFKERADDKSHPHKKHYEYFVEQIIKFL